MDSVYTKNSYAKVNIFLKISAKRESYHEIVSRFVKVKNLFDEMSFIKGKFDKFTLEGNFGCKTEQNTIYKAYMILCEQNKVVKEFFKNYKVSVKKSIPEFAGLGGGSSNCACFINMVNDICKLGLSKDQLANIGATIGADVPFFIYEYDSANVTGIGEVVQLFDEPSLDIHTFTPNIECNTGKIFTTFRDKFYKEISNEDGKKLLAMKSKDILETLSIEEANDLYEPACEIYPELKNIEKIQNTKCKVQNYFSGSGSSFFYIK